MSSFNSRRRSSILLPSNQQKPLLLSIGKNPNLIKHAPLLSEDAGGSSQILSEQDENANSSLNDIHASNLLDISKPTNVLKELKYYVTNSIPLITTFLLQYSLSLSSLLIVGNLCTIKEFSSLSLAIMFYNITGLSPIEGVATCLDSYCSTSYSSGNFKYVGVFAVRCYLLILCMLVPVFISWFSSGYWMQFILPPQHYDLIPDIAKFLKIISIGMPALTLFETGKRYVQAQGFYEITTLSLIFIFPINLFLIYFLTLKLGYIGAPMAIAISHWLMGFSLIIYCLKIRPETLKCWMPLKTKIAKKQEILFEEEVEHSIVQNDNSKYGSVTNSTIGDIEDQMVSPFFQNWLAMLKLAFPGLLMILSEYLSFEILTIFTTFLGDEELIAIQTVIASLGTLMYQDLFGLGVVVSTRIGQFIGSAYFNSEPPLVSDNHTPSASESQAIKNTQKSIIAGHAAAFVIAFFNFVILTQPFFSKPLISLFTTDPVVIEGALKIIWILGINQLFDGFSVLYSSVLRAQGRQNIGGILNIIAYYCIGLPVAFYLSFGEAQGFSWGLGMGIKGLWLGCGSGILFLAVSQGLYVWFCGWLLILRESYYRLK
ncbi:hypothetical protein QEN19_001260 [Hanseniaspora menglaensis]